MKIDSLFKWVATIGIIIVTLAVGYNYLVFIPQKAREADQRIIFEKIEKCKEEVLEKQSEQINNLGLPNENGVTMEEWSTVVEFVANTTKIQSKNCEAKYSNY